MSVKLRLSIIIISIFANFLFAADDPNVVVPNLVSLPIADAATVVSDVGLVLGEINYNYHPSIDLDHVIYQSLAAGSLASAGTTIDLTVSLGIADLLEGSGTASDPYLIHDLADFDIFSDPNNYDHYYWSEGIHTKLMSDIDLSGREYYRSVIAWDTTPWDRFYTGVPYRGVFLGNGHTISNLVFESGPRSYVGLFGQISDTARVANLNCTNAVINTDIWSGYAGVLCGQSYGNISDCFTDGSVSGEYISGGLCGRNNGTISSSYTTGSVSGDQYVGGLCGHNYKGTISNCYSSCSVSGDQYVGGLCGYNRSGIIYNCYSTGSVSGISAFGGICGYQFSNDASISNSFWDIQTSGTTIGCFVGSGVIENVLGKTSVEMQHIDTFISAGWDFVGETANGSDDIWFMGGYPVFSWIDQSTWINVPDLTNLSQADAEYLVIQEGFNFGAVSYINNDNISEGLIADQYPAPGTDLPAGALVSLVVSLGPWPLVPDLSGLDENQAQTAITDAGMVVGNITYINDDYVAQGLVVSQTPASGEKVALDTSIDFIISIGPWPIVPDLSGLTEAQAKAAINNAGLNVGEISHLCDDLVQQGHIISQSPQADTVLPTGSSVNFVVSLGVFVPLEGSGTESDPYLIRDLKDFEVFSDPNYHTADYWAEGVYTSLMADIDLSGREYYRAVIAWNTTPLSPNFTGVSYDGIFNGNGYNISNLVIDSGTATYVGLFGHISETARVENLNCTDAEINSDIAGERVGIVCGDNHGTISNCYSDGSIFCFGLIGGLCGNNVGTISDSYATGSLSGKTLIGGLCGKNHSGIITNCYSSCSVSQSEYYYYSLFGGLCGSNVEGTINSCYSTSTVSGSKQVGGLCGHNTDGTISNSYATGNVSGNDEVGGLCGSNSEGIIVACYYTGTVSGNDYVGGLCGENYRGTIDNCYSTGTVSGDDQIGGFCGKNYKETISNCYSTCEVSGVNVTGGFCGYNEFGTITNCYSTGSASGDSYVSGFCGYTYGDSYIGMANSFWDIQTSGTTIGYYTNESGTVTNVLGKTTIEMQNIKTFIDAGWDFADEVDNGPDDIWRMPAADYPVLAWRQGVPNINSDSFVDITDFALFAGSWLSINGDELYTIKSDFDGDDSVNLIDLQIFTEQWLFDFNFVPVLPLQLYWAFDETDGDIAYESSEYQMNGSVHGMPNHSPGKVNNCLQFDGIDDFVEINGYQGVDGNKARTVAAWIKANEDLLNAEQNYHTIVSWGSMDLSGMWAFVLDFNTGQLSVNNMGASITGGPDLEDSQWHHVAAVLPYGADSIEQVLLYVDGTEVATSVEGYDTSINTKLTGNVLIGALDLNESNSYDLYGLFKGSIDEVGIFHRALNQTEVQQLYQIP